VKFVYAVAKLSGGGVQFEVMSKAQVDSIRRRSKSGNSGPWVSDYVEMARKTVVRRLFKYLPVSVELVKALEIQAAAESGEFEQAEITIEVESDAVPDPEQKGVSTLKDLMTGGK
jgi:recombination protein RecT